MKLANFICLIAISLLGILSLKADSVDQKNIVLIICDDLNDYIEGLDGHPQAITPNIKQLAQEGISFTNAHSNNPVCAPSRSSFLTGIYPHTSKNLFWAKWYENPVLKNETGGVSRWRRRLLGVYDWYEAGQAMKSAKARASVKRPK